MNGCHWHLEMFALDRARGECTLANTAAGAQPVYVDISHSIRSIFTEKPPDLLPPPSERVLLPRFSFGDA